MSMISISEIERMSRDAYERGKHDGRAEERQRWYEYIASLDVDLDERRLQNDILKAIRKADE